MSIPMAEAVIDMTRAESREDRRLREATDLYLLATDQKLEIMQRIRMIADQLEARRS
jgi:hypothetical protein